MKLSRRIGKRGHRQRWFAGSRTAAGVWSRPRNVAVLLVVAALVIDVALLWEARSTALEGARAMASDRASLLAEQANTAFKTTDLALQAAQQRLEREDLAQHDAGFRAYLTMMLERLGYVRAIFVVGPDGYITQDTDYPHTPVISLADRSYFSTLRDSEEDALHIGKPLLSRSVGRWFMPVARRINRADGAFAGTVVAAVEPLFFESIYSQLHLSQHDAIALFHADSTLVARMPPRTDLYGKQLKQFQLFTAHLPTASRSVYDIPDALTGRAVVIGYEKLPALPLIVTAVVDRSEALAGWWLLFWVIVLSSVAITALALLLYATVQRRRLERQVASQEASMHEKLETIGLMARSVAHDYKNLLGVIRAGVRLLRRRGPTEAVLAGIEEAVDRGNRLTADLLRFARSGDVERRTIDPSDQIERLITLVRQAAHPRVDLHLDLAPSVGYVHVSPALFDAMILNLVVNASQAMPDGGELRISTRKVSSGGDAALSKGDYVRIGVADTGHGIPVDALARVFEPFVTGKSKGTGLGLFQAKRFATEAGGDIRATSSDRGTEFEILLPMAPADPATP